ncbi:hypothetical protein QVD17_35564 [Tagetes erecta]|uniref:Reverse transcriptase domain-containing protein n=1 Tax=Tagetes erecta TaxID=13708 RepID=A0AAD8K2E2_TARER|nr:hypothetical protein QVD17_35564 [Tagetes erecta]
MYKTMLANRIKGVIDLLIGEEQTAFISGRHILDGPLIVSESAAWMKASKGKGFFLKVDFEKAYDMSFALSRGLRQGDPLSPFLFILVMEALNVALNSAKEDGTIQGIRLPNNGPEISHVFYADDALLMGEWSIINALNVVRILRCFDLASGLKINFNKSCLYGIGLDTFDMELGALIFNCQIGLFPFIHLGIPIGANMSRVSSWKPISDKFKARLSGWKERTLSFGGRLTLIKAVLGSIPTYYLSLFKAPVKVIKELESIRRRFLWGNTRDGRGIAWVKWADVIAQKSAGGCGVGSIRDMNLSLLAKWIWRFRKEPAALWAKVINAIHTQPRKFSGIPVNKKINGVWLKINSIEDDMLKENISMEKLCRANVGNGVKKSQKDVLLRIDSSVGLGGGSGEGGQSQVFYFLNFNNCVLFWQIVV